MSPLIPAIGVITFLISFSLHVIWWRWRCPKSDILILILLFFIIPGIFIIPAYILHVSFIDFALIILLHSALSGAYILSYPAVQAECPSLKILLIVNNTMPDGITKEGIEQLLGCSSLLDTIINKMVEEGLAKEENDLITPTKFGNITAGIFIMLRSFLGIEEGGG